MQDLSDRAPQHRAKIMGFQQATIGSVWIIGALTALSRSPGKLCTRVERFVLLDEAGAKLCDELCPRKRNSSGERILALHTVLSVPV